jgi:hypothetical protein
MQKSTIAALMEFNKIFLPDVGLVPDMLIKITLSNANHIHLKPYLMLHSLLLRAKETVKKHVKAGTLTPSLSLE